MPLIATSDRIELQGDRVLLRTTTDDAADHDWEDIGHVASMATEAAIWDRLDGLGLVEALDQLALWRSDWETDNPRRHYRSY